MRTLRNIRPTGPHTMIADCGTELVDLTGTLCMIYESDPMNAPSEAARDLVVFVQANVNAAFASGPALFANRMSLIDAVKRAFDINSLNESLPRTDHKLAVRDLIAAIRRSAKGMVS